MAVPWVQALSRIMGKVNHAQAQCGLAVLSPPRQHSSFPRPRALM